MRRVAKGKSQLRNVLNIGGAVENVAGDDKDGFIAVFLGHGADTVEIDAAKIHRQAKPRVERGGLRHSSNQIRATADDDRICDEQSQDDEQQPRHRQAPASAPLPRPLRDHSCEPGNEFVAGRVVLRRQDLFGVTLSAAIVSGAASASIS